MKTYIWSLPTRLSHWLVLPALVITYFLGGEEEYINAHTALGYLAGTLILFRIIWGIVGPRYSKFSDFPIGISKMKEFVTNMKSSKSKYPGHNPAASVIMLAILVAIILVAVSGMLNLAAEGQGFLSFMKLNGESEFYGEAHEVMVNVLIALVALHLAGIAADTIFHRENGTLASIFTGYKKVQGDDVKLNGFQKVFSVLWIAGALTFFGVTMATSDIKLSDTDPEKNNTEMKGSGEEDEDDD
jgi:cytochrome b